MHRFLLLFVLAIGAAGQSAEVVVNESRLYGTPSASGKVVTSLPKWSQIEILKQGDAWVLVQAAEYVGWMPARAIAIKTPAVDITVSIPASTAPASAPRQTYQTIAVPAAGGSRSSPEAVPPAIQTLYTDAKTEPVPVTSTAGTISISPPVAKETAAAAKEVAAGPATGKCKDGTLSHAVEKQGACSNHGGIDSWYADEAKETDSSPTYTAPVNPPGTGVQVRGYYRKDGTYVKPHTRSSPGRRKP